MRQISKRPQFLLDLAEELIWLREKAGADIADEWFQELEITIELLKKHPHLGRQRKDLSPPGIRSWRISGFPRWLLFYQIDRKDNLVLLRVRQGTMNLVILKMKS